jgi:hypothetical protein
MKKVLISLLSALLFTACNKTTTKNTEKTNDADTATTAFKPANIKEEILYQRGVEAAIWGMPAVNYQLMYNAFAKIKGNYNQVVIWPKLLDWKNQTLTPNPDVIYLMPFFNTEKAGPIVLEIPPADTGVFNGSVMTYWQNSIQDVGPGGVDKGKGGKYLFLPPGYDKTKIPAGYIALQSNTYRGYALLRSVLKSGSATDVAAAVAYAKRIKVYPLNEDSKNPATQFIDASEQIYESNIPFDFTLYKTLNEIIQQEPGIERGKVFNPDERTKEILAFAAKTARSWLDSNLEDTTPFFKGTHWIFPVTPEFGKNIQGDYLIPDSYPVDNRGLLYTLGFFSAKHIGESQFYLMQIVDKDGNPLDGSSSYKVNIPANAPVKQYWSMTVYNRETHTFIRNVKWAGRSSQTPRLKTNTDGSVNLYFGPTPPESGESNWVPTDPKGKFEILARFYGPKPNLYDQSWKLNDLEKVK